MRAAAIAFIIVLALAPSLAFAQAAGPGAISRDQFVQQRADAAGRLFDQIDTNHTGYITRAQLRAYLRGRRGGGPPPQQ